MTWGRALLLSSALALAGCHSAYVEATVTNATAQPVSLVEMDYPSASFGVQTLAPGESLRYRFKILGSGAAKLLWTDAGRIERHADGPTLQEGQEGQLVVTVNAGGVDWQTNLRKP